MSDIPGNGYNLARLQADMEWVKETLRDIQENQKGYARTDELSALRRLVYGILLAEVSAFLGIVSGLVHLP